MIKATILFVIVFLDNNSNASDYEDSLKTGIVFHKDSRITLAEKLINAEFFVPFPKYRSTIQDISRNYFQPCQLKGNRSQQIVASTL